MIEALEMGVTSPGLPTLADIESSKARKGTSWNQIARLFAAVDPAWTENRVTSARLIARGLIALMGHQAGDRRLLALAEELASVLHTMGRGRSPVVRHRLPRPRAGGRRDRRTRRIPPET